MLRAKLETVLAPVSYQSSRRRRQRKRMLLKVPIMYWYALNVSRMLTGRAENAASVRIFENAQALALVDV